jgi:Mn2+/Fe2+ NRAMP family transporter
LFALGVIGTGMLGVPVLAGSCAYAIAEASRWRGSLEDRPHLAKGFYAVIAAPMALGLALAFAGCSAVAMLCWSAVLNGVLAPPLIASVTKLTGDHREMAEHVNPPLLKWLGWTTAGAMTAAAAAMLWA